MGIKVSFFMVAYNTEKYIEKSIRSILNQTEKDINLFVRDNGSTDSTYQIIQKLAAEDSRIVVLHNTNNGITDDGIYFAERGWWYPDDAELGEYISIVDSDDEIEAKFVEILYANAKKNHADMAFAGNYFVSDDTIVGKRVPPFIETCMPSGLEPYFEEVYNCFRTWWGKLYKTDLFEEFFDYAWEPGIPIWWRVDTIVTMRYLQNSKKITAVDQPLYRMTLHENSTYRTREVASGRILEAMAIYNNNYEFLKQADILNDRLLEYIQITHWSYIKENFDVLIATDKMTPADKMEWLTDVMRDEIVGQYCHSHYAMIMFQMKPALESIMEQLEDDRKYDNYLCRLSALLDILEANPGYDMAYVVLFGCLFDVKNIWMFGDEFLELPIEGVSNGVKRALEFSYPIRRWWKYHKWDFLDLIYSVDFTTEIQSQVQEMVRLWKEGNLNGACELSCDILEKSPFSVRAIICRIMYWEAIGEPEEAFLLRKTMSMIWEEEFIERVFAEFEQ
ncbi:MAG: glycosyltransferase family 2 protein [bacterium]|nr:glycosyltransferase family 2 protein [bacterium]